MIDKAMIDKGRRAMAYRIGIGTAFALSITGCVNLGGGKPPAQLYTLTAASQAPVGNAASSSLSEAIMVIEPSADLRLSVTRVPVQVDSSTVAYLQDANWIERPARLFGRLLAETLRSKGGRLVIEGTPANMGGKLRLSGQLLEMGYDARSQSAVLIFDAAQENSKGKIETRRFESRQRGIAPNAASVIPALNRAANDVAGQVANWVG